MLEKIKNNFKNNRTKISLTIGVCLFTILIIGSTYAYFGINATSNSSNANVVKQIHPDHGQR